MTPSERRVEELLNALRDPRALPYELAPLLRAFAARERRLALEGAARRPPLARPRTGAAMMSAARAVPCPTCGAKAGEWCVLVRALRAPRYSPPGRILALFPHMSRYAIAREQR